MSDTPRTDAGAFWVTSPTDPEMREEVVVSHFARQLEREPSAAPAAPVAFDIVQEYEILTGDVACPLSHKAALREIQRRFAPSASAASLPHHLISTIRQRCGYIINGYSDPKLEAQEIKRLLETAPNGHGVPWPFPTISKP